MPPSLLYYYYNYHHYRCRFCGGTSRGSYGYLGQRFRRFYISTYVIDTPIKSCYCANLKIHYGDSFVACDGADTVLGLIYTTACRPAHVSHLPDLHLNSLHQCRSKEPPLAWKMHPTIGIYFLGSTRS